ncbi:MAG: SH3 domain-containing protein, partial [Gemmatimonadales bacterium]
RSLGAPRAIVAASASLRVSPHGLAAEQGSVPAFRVVKVERGAPGWWLVQTRDGARGWVPDDVVAPVPRLN